MVAGPTLECCTLTLYFLLSGLPSGLEDCAILHKSFKGQLVPEMNVGFCPSYSAVVGLWEATPIIACPTNAFLMGLHQSHLVLSNASVSPCATTSQL